METLSEGFFIFIFYWFYILIMNIIAIEILAFHITLLKDKGTYGPLGKTLVISRPNKPSALACDLNCSKFSLCLTCLF